MTSWIRFWFDSALLVMTLVAGGLVLYLAAPRARMRPVLHPVACHGWSANAPLAVIAARDAHLARSGAFEIETCEELETTTALLPATLAGGTLACSTKDVPGPVCPHPDAPRPVPSRRGSSPESISAGVGRVCFRPPHRLDSVALQVLADGRRDPTPCSVAEIVPGNLDDLCGVSPGTGEFSGEGWITRLTAGPPERRAACGGPTPRVSGAGQRLRRARRDAGG
jgi:hypothetical protein